MTGKQGDGRKFRLTARIANVQQILEQKNATHKTRIKILLQRNRAGALSTSPVQFMKKRSAIVDDTTMSAISWDAKHTAQRTAINLTANNYLNWSTFPQMVETLLIAAVRAPLQ